MKKIFVIAALLAAFQAQAITVVSGAHVAVVAAHPVTTAHVSASAKAAPATTAKSTSVAPAAKATAPVIEAKPVTAPVIVGHVASPSKPASAPKKQ